MIRSSNILKKCNQQTPKSKGQYRKSDDYYVLLIVIALICFAKSVCADEGAAIQIPPPIDGKNPYSNNLTQENIKFDVITIYSADKREITFNVELALTPIEQAKGLMFRENMDKNSGMLFLFKDIKDRTFWMKNTVIPLDILFIRDDGVIQHIHRNATPYSLERIPSQGDVRAVLEVNGGICEEHNINIGDVIDLKIFEHIPI